MAEINIRAKRKDEHLDRSIAFQDPSPSPFREIKLIRRALPETCLETVDTHTTLFGKALDFPLIIEAMTGGTERSKKINEGLAQIASSLNIGLALGSCSIVADNPGAIISFAIAREANPDGLIIANCSPTTPIEAISQTLDATRANALQIHINAVQEMAMKEGDRDFRWWNNILAIRKNFNLPIIVKEVGFGIDRDTAKLLTSKGIMIDLGGSGGTDFAAIENERAGTSECSELSTIGLTTPESLIEMQSVPGAAFIASGGIRTPLDILKCLSLNALAVGIANPVLKAFEARGLKGTLEYLSDLIQKTRQLICLFGCQNIRSCQNIDKVFTGDLRDFQLQRKGTKIK